MFDIGFWEILVLLIILLLVVGPERLPTVARTAAVWVRKARRLMAQVKQEVKLELQAEELQQSLKKHEELSDIDEVIGESKPPHTTSRQEKRPDPKGSNDNA